MRRLLSLLFVLASLLAAAPAPAQVLASDTAEAVFAYGDRMVILVWRQDDLSGEFAIGSNGTIVHPLYQSVQVVGLTVTQTEERLREFLRRFEQNPQLVVQPLFRVTVGGEVNAPEVYEFGPEVTIGRAIALAGGVTPRGQLSRVRLIRGGVRRHLDLRNPAHAQMRVRSSDQIEVRRRVHLVQDVLIPAGGVVFALNQLWAGSRTLFGF